MDTIQIAAGAMDKRTSPKMTVTDEDDKNYQLIAQAIDYIRSNFKNQPDLDELADEFGYHPHYFQRIFKAWAGISPKKFLEYVTLQAAQQDLAKGSLLDLSLELGLSSSSRLYELFVRWEALTPGEFRKAGMDLTIDYFATAGPFGWTIIGATGRGICYIGFGESAADCIAQLKGRFPYAGFKEAGKGSRLPEYYRQIFTKKAGQWQIPLHVMGTAFQVKVWRSLLRIDCNAPASYGQIAEATGKPGAGQAVGNAVGKNPLAYLIPCHRVLKSNGGLGGYHYGTRRKQTILVHEALSPWQTKLAAGGGN